MRGEISRRERKVKITTYRGEKKEHTGDQQRASKRVSSEGKKKNDSHSLNACAEESEAKLSTSTPSEARTTSRKNGRPRLRAILAVLPLSFSYSRQPSFSNEKDLAFNSTFRYIPHKKKKEEIRSVTSEARRSKYRKADNNNNKKDHVLPGVNSVVFKKKKKTARTVSVSSRNVRPRLNRKKNIYIYMYILFFLNASLALTAHEATPQICFQPSPPRLP